VVQAVFVVLVIAISSVAMSRYPGTWFVYMLFTVIANALLINGFRSSALFFDTFIGVLLWLGFWLIFSLRLCQGIPQFTNVPRWGGTAEEFDHVLLVSCCGLAAFLFAAKIREKFFSYPHVGATDKKSAIAYCYQRHRKWIVILCFVLVASVAVSNFVLGVYQRGLVSVVELPRGVSGIYAWLLLFGLTSLVAIIVHCEMQINRNISWVSICLVCVENFLSNVSMLSRGAIINLASIALGLRPALRSAAYKVTSGRQILAFLLAGTVVVCSVLVVNYLREIIYNSPTEKLLTTSVDLVDLNGVMDSTKALFTDRWVGIHGVAAIVSADNLGLKMWTDAWSEKYDTSNLTSFDANFIDSGYKANVQSSRLHFISLPGIIAFMYLSGSMLFLFVALLLCGLVAAAIEVFAYFYAGKNLILCALFGQVIAYRYVHFGYVPSQSYLLLGALLGNIALIWLVETALRHYLRQGKVHVA
jgi:hypothetical protein